MHTLKFKINEERSSVVFKTAGWPGTISHGANREKLCKKQKHWRGQISKTWQSLQCIWRLSCMSMTQVTVEHMYYTGNRACSCYLSCNYVDHAMLQYPRFFLLPEFSGSTSSSSTFCAFIGMQSVQGAFDDIHQCNCIFVFVFVSVFCISSAPVFVWCDPYSNEGWPGGGW